jgi:hypothetical protein
MIDGQYFIDLSIPPVPKTVPHVVAGSENLLIHTTSGPISADVWVTGNNKLKRVSMKISSDDKYVDFAVVRCIVQNFSSKLN